MILQFRAKELRQLVEAEKVAEPNRVPYTGGSFGVPERKERGLKLVGDQGVYFMANSAKLSPVYAQDCSPSDDYWWSLKRDSFGGDDGVIFMGIEGIEAWVASAENVADEFCEVDLNPETVSLLSYTYE